MRKIKIFAQIRYQLIGTKKIFLPNYENIGGPALESISTDVLIIGAGPAGLPGKCLRSDKSIHKMVKRLVKLTTFLKSAKTAMSSDLL